VEHLVSVMVVAGSDPPEFYVWCENHQWSSSSTTSDSDEADRWVEAHKQFAPLLAS
jgi:hypothetical protein